MKMIIQTDRLTRAFGGLVAVDDVDFALEPGEIRGLIGPNGSGKTTLVNLMTGVYEPTSGDIVYKGKKITGLNPNIIANMGLLRTFQVPRLFNSMSILENMLIPRFSDFSLGYRKEYIEAVNKAEELMEMAGILHLRDHSAKTLSGGQKALLQIIRAFMAKNISLFMLDEPFAGVNIVVKETIMDLITHKAGEGLTFLIVSHEMASIRRLCPRVTVLAEGAIICEGNMDEVAADEHVINAYLGG
ncbi:MAG: ABC transporter ATP-binding protein [Anaerolineales bacterium]|nr:ABC transporter ATP-binding protein [Anaerolineales bacterium]